MSPIQEQEPWLSEQKDIKILERGSKVLIDGIWSEIQDFKFHITPDETPVYNFTVPGTNTYIAEKTVVHNK